MYGKRIFQYAFMIAVSFCCGVLCFRYTALEQAESVIGIFDQRVLTLEPYLFVTLLPIALSILIVLIFSTHPYFYSVAILFITIKAVFFGFSSVYIINELDRMDLYIKWWFPFQFVYLLFLIFLYKMCRVKTVRKKAKMKKLLPFALLLVAIVIYLETVMISMVFK